MLETKNLLPSDVKMARAKNAILFLLLMAAAALSFGPLSTLVRTGRPADYYSHIPLIPVVSGWILLRRAKNLSKGETGSPLLGGAVITLGIALVIFDWSCSPGIIAHAELRAAGAILILSGAFVALFGNRAFRRGLFPFLFLAFIIPLPITWMNFIVSILVSASTGITHLLFQALGVPFVQGGAIFYLPGFDIQVAQECSGIRSSLALLITSALAGQTFLDRPWKKIVLILAVLPITVLKNAVRIVTLYLLSYFVDIRIIQGGFLHRTGGFIFFGIGLLILGYVLWLLRSLREV